MPNRVRLSVVDHKADDFMDALEQGLFSADAATLEALGPEGTALFSTSGMGTELRISYTTTDGEVHATRFVVSDAEGVSLRGRFDDPEPLGFGSWSESVGTLKDALYDALLGDSQFDVRGNKADNGALGSEFDDTFRMGAGNDSAHGGAGDDVLNGGRDNDLLILGDGDDRADGGAGNDVIVTGSGRDVVSGGSGSNIFVESWINNLSDGPNRTVIRDFNANDLLVLADHDGPIGPIAGETLADLENGTIDEFHWRETNGGVRIEAGDAVVVLRGLDADEIDLDQILFAEASVEEAVTMFDTLEGGGILGRPPGGDPYYVITMENLVGVSNGVESFRTWGGDVSGFITWGENTGV